VPALLSWSFAYVQRLDVHGKGFIAKDDMLKIVREFFLSNVRVYQQLKGVLQVA
jgi:hypothetical protein